MLSFFLAPLVLFWCYNLESRPAGLAVSLATFLSIVHVVTTFSMLGRIITATSAMGPTPILPKEREEELAHEDLTNVLLAEAKIHRQLNIPINKQYMTNNHVNGLECPYSTSLRRRHPGVELAYDFHDKNVEQHGCVK